MIVSGVQGPDQMNHQHLIRNTLCEILLVVLKNPFLSVCTLAMINQFVKK